MATCRHDQVPHPMNARSREWLLKKFIQRERILKRIRGDSKIQPCTQEWPHPNKDVEFGLSNYGKLLFDKSLGRQKSSCQLLGRVRLNPTRTVHFSESIQELLGSTKRFRALQLCLRELKGEGLIEDQVQVYCEESGAILSIGTVALIVSASS